MKGNYIGNNPNGLDFVLVDNKTTIEKNKKIVSKDIAINGDDTDLASKRGQIGKDYLLPDGGDLNDLRTPGNYGVRGATWSNVPEKTYARVQVINGAVQTSNFSEGLTQLWCTIGLAYTHWFSRSFIGATQTWSDWVKIVDATHLATSSTPGIVQLNNTTSSTSASQAATANAVKLAYDKAVEAYTKAVEAYTKAESAQGSSTSADKLTTARTIQNNLASTASASFDGTENVTHGVTGVLPVASGGTGRTDGKAPSLVTKRTIDGVSFNGSANITHYGTCSTEAATVDKVVSVTSFTLATGAVVYVRFTVTNTAASPTLNVNSTGAKAIRYRNAAISAGYLAANRTYCFIYDGTYYQLVGDIDTNTKYTAASETPKAPGTAAVGTSSKYAREDHIHPLQTTVSGNAGTATKLATARTISLTGVVEGSVSFDGSKNVSITTTADGIGGSIPIGGIIAFSGTFGGTNNRFPIPLGSTAPDTNWCLCDGTTTNGKTVPDLRGRMILGASSTYTAGTKGGSETHTHSISGTVGATTLTVSQMPSHTHTFSKGTYGNIAEARGSANDGKQTTDATGGSSSHTHSLSESKSTSASSFPPYYALAYIMRCA